MISTQVQAALSLLQNKALAARDGYEIDRLDRAMDELLRHPDSLRPAPFQVRSARANASKVLASRRRLADGLALADGGTAAEFALVEWRHWLATTPYLAEPERALLADLANGEDATTLAAREGSETSRVRCRISRARANARSAYRRCGA